MIPGIAWRNIWRNRRRSGVILAAIALGLSGGLFACGFMGGMAASMVEAGIDRSLAHLQLHAPRFKRDRQIADVIPDAAGVLSVLDTLTGVAGVSPRAMIQGMALSPAANSAVTICGIDPAAERRTTRIAAAVAKGAFLSADDGNAVIAGGKLAEKLGLRLGSKLVLSFAGRDGTIAYGAFRVEGIFATASAAFDRGTVFVRRRDLEGLAGGGILVHEIAVRLRDGEMTETMRDLLRARYPRLAVDDWRDLAPDLRLAADTTDVSMLFFVGIILLALLFGITNTVLMSVLDRTREIGVLMAIGMKRKRVFALIVLETLFLSLTGGVAGICAGALLVAVTARTGITLALFAEGLSTYGISAVVHPVLPLAVCAEVAALTVATALCASVYPAMKAIRMRPAEATRTVK